MMMIIPILIITIILIIRIRDKIEGKKNQEGSKLSDFVFLQISVLKSRDEAFTFAAIFDFELQ